MPPLPEVDDYLAAAPPERQPVLNEIREACLDLLPGFTETIHHGIPSYERHEVVEIAFASLEACIAFCVLHTDVIEAHRPRLSGLDVEDDCIRFARPEQIDMDLIRSILKMSALTSGPSS